MRQETRESPAQLWGGSVVRAYGGSVRLYSILLHSSHIVRALSRWYGVYLTTSTQDETTEHCPVYPAGGQKDPRIPAVPVRPSFILTSCTGGISKMTLSIRHICHICRVFPETFSAPVFHRSFPQTASWVGVFDVPKSIGLVWSSASLSVDARFPCAPVTLHPSGGDLRKTVLDCETPFRIHAMWSARGGCLPIGSMRCLPSAQERDACS
jgi:hypothetical protein